MDHLRLSSYFSFDLSVSVFAPLPAKLEACGASMNTLIKSTDQLPNHVEADINTEAHTSSDLFEVYLQVLHPSRKVSIILYNK